MATYYYLDPAGQSKHDGPPQMLGIIQWMADNGITSPDCALQGSEIGRRAVADGHVVTKKLTGEAIFAYYARRMERELGVRQAKGQGRGSGANVRKSAPAPGLAAREAPASVRLTIGADGRVVIPADLRRAMLLDESGAVTARMVDGGLSLITPRAAVAQARRLVQAFDTGKGSPVDELIAERRAEAERE